MLERSSTAALLCRRELIRLSVTPSVHAKSTAVRQASLHANWVKQGVSIDRCDIMIINGFVSIIEQLCKCPYMRPHKINGRLTGCSCRMNRAVDFNWHMLVRKRTVCPLRINIEMTGSTACKQSEAFCCCRQTGICFSEKEQYRLSDEQQRIRKFVHAKLMAASQTSLHVNGMKRLVDIGGGKFYCRKDHYIDYHINTRGLVYASTRN